MGRSLNPSFLTKAEVDALVKASNKNVWHLRDELHQDSLYLLDELQRLQMESPRSHSWTICGWQTEALYYPEDYEKVRSLLTDAGFKVDVTFPSRHNRLASPSITITNPRS